MQVSTLCIFWDHVFSIPQILATVAYEIRYFYISCILIWYDDICVFRRKGPGVFRRRRRGEHIYICLCLCMCWCVSEEGTGCVPEA